MPERNTLGAAVVSLGLVLAACTPTPGASEAGETSPATTDLPGDSESSDSSAGSSDESQTTEESGCVDCPAGLGTPCADPQQCERGWCVDGVCCESSCDQPCHSCSDAPGSCVPVADGPDPGCSTTCSAGACLPCPVDMALVSGQCIDRFEAPNHEGALPLVMYTLVEAEAWCAARGKTLCLDSLWQAACQGQAMTAYPYGDAHQPGLCNDDETWIAYNQSLLDGWPPAASHPQIESLDDLLAQAAAQGPAAAAAADHVAALYQAEPAGANLECSNETTVFDLTGNVEEWTRREDGGAPDFHGNLKGRYWAETRTCAQNVTVHGDQFRFYEIGFRCCMN